MASKPRSFVCLCCGELGWTTPTRIRSGAARYCSNACAGRARRKESTINSNGYVEVWSDSGESVLEHRLVMEKTIGRRLRRDEHVHHINKDTTDNRIENLMIVAPSEHAVIHHSADGWSWEYDSCVQCGTTERKHGAFGMCEKCYKAKVYRDTHPLRGWSKHSDRCLECGEVDRKHFAIGLCEPCYFRVRYRKGHPERAWSKHSPSCLSCQTTELKHCAKGYCKPCYDRQYLATHP